MASVEEASLANDFTDMITDEDLDTGSNESQVELCFICNEPQQLESSIDDLLKASGLPCTDKQKSNLLQLICSLLHIGWKKLESMNCFHIPFCGNCASFAVQLMTMRNQIIQVETEMRHLVEDIQDKIQQSQLQLTEYKMETKYRQLFRKHALREYYGKSLMRVKILEFNQEKGERHVIEIEPSFVQYHFVSAAAPSHNTETPEELRLSVDMVNRIADQEMAAVKHQRGPITRFRSSGGQGRNVSKIKEEPLLELDDETIAKRVDQLVPQVDESDLMYAESAYSGAGDEISDNSDNSSDSDYKVVRNRSPRVKLKSKKTNSRNRNEQPSNINNEVAIPSKTGIGMARVLVSRRRAKKLYYNDYGFCFMRILSKQREWICEKRNASSGRCKARIRTGMNLPEVDEFVPVLWESKFSHSHPCDPYNLIKNVVLQRLQNLETGIKSESETSTMKIVENITQDLPQSAFEHLPSKSSLVRRVRRIKEVNKLTKKPVRRPDNDDLVIPPETFEEIQIMDDGRKLYEGVEIRELPSRGRKNDVLLHCGHCTKEIEQQKAREIGKSVYKLMKQHIRAAHTDAYKCTLCGKKLSEHRILWKHMYFRHGKGKKRPKARVFGNDKYPAEVMENEDGTVHYQGIQILRRDINEDDYDVECGTCGKVFNKIHSNKYKLCPYRALINHIKAAHLGAIFCQQCGRTYSCRKALRTHMEKKHMHVPNKASLKCDVCGKPICNRQYMEKHVWSHKNEEERKLALAAGIKAPRKYSDYMEKVRANAPQFQCAECGKTFHFNANLRRHEHIHKKEKNCQCTFCGKLFLTPERLNAHVRYIHEIERVHKKYRCNYCEKWFTSKSPWEKHERTHTKILPYICPNCPKAFALKRSLNTHIQGQKCNTEGTAKSHQTPRNHHRKKSAPIQIQVPHETMSGGDSGGSGNLPASEHEENHSFVRIPPSGRFMSTPGQIVQELPIPIAHSNFLPIPTSSSSSANNFPSYLRQFEQQHFLQHHYNNY